MSWIIKRKNNNSHNSNQDYESDKSANDTSEKHENYVARSYQDLANSIRRVRIRRQEMKSESKEETPGEWGERRGERQHIMHGNDDGNNGDHNMPDRNGDDSTETDADAADGQETDRLERLEKKIEMEQNKKVREEFLLSHKDNDESDNHLVGNPQHEDPNKRIDLGLPNKASVDDSPSPAISDKEYKAMNENLEALKLLNEKRHNHNRENNDDEVKDVTNGDP